MQLTRTSKGAVTSVPGTCSVRTKAELGAYNQSSLEVQGIKLRKCDLNWKGIADFDAGKYRFPDLAIL